MELMVGDIGGTNARFAIANRAADGQIALSDEQKFRVADYVSLESAWKAYVERLGRTPPAVASVAVAAPVDKPRITLANNPWAIVPADVQAQMGLRELHFVNDFAAVAHAVRVLPPDRLGHVAGPDQPLPDAGPVTVLGPGTGLGVALLITGGDGRVIPTEGGHMDFAPLDYIEDRILAELRQRYRRVSVERIVAGPGLLNLYESIARIEGREFRAMEDSALWAKVQSDPDTLVRAAFDRWCMTLGSVAGDLALAQGAKAVVIAGGIIPRIAHLLSVSGFHARFTAKGRFEAMMKAMPIRRVLHPEPGLLGAAAAYFLEHDR